MSAAGPRITVFSCSYCGAVPRELAAVERIPYPSNVHVVEFPCMGRVQGDVVLSAFEAGADGVLLVGCEEGNCHHQGGNLRALRRLAAMQAMLDEVGLGGARLSIWLGGLGQPTRFARRLTDFVGEIASMGESPLKSGGDAVDTSATEAAV